MIERDGLALYDVRCSHPRGCGVSTEVAAVSALVLVRRGCFVRDAEGLECLLDPTAGYFVRAGEEQRFDHPHAGGDSCTSIAVSEGLLASIWGGRRHLPKGAIAISPRLDLSHRKLLAHARRGGEGHALFERSIELIAEALEAVDPRPVGSARPHTARSHRALAAGVREALVEDSARSLPELARVLAVSPHHLSRVFRAVTGHSISRHRMRLRARTALERLFDGERDIARLASELGFADQSHLSRVLREEAGTTPGALRAVLGGVDDTPAPLFDP